MFENIQNLSKEQLIELLYRLEQENENIKKNIKYGLTWEEDKIKEQFEFDLENNYPLLIERKEKTILTNIEEPTNLLIEGDNYHSLSVLQYTHKGRIDIIYIDPPYNTGSKDFAYNDKYVGNDDTYRHSKWLNFMSKRLKLAKELLTDNGIIFISIDDNEQAQLKLLCDNIFGEQNFIANFIRKTAVGEKTAKPYVNKHHEYCFCYAKNIDNVIKNEILSGDEKGFESYSNPDNDSNGEWIKDSYLIKIDNGRKGLARYPIINPYLNITHYPPVYYNEKDRKQWHYVEETFKRMEREGKVVYYKTLEEMGNNKYSFYIKKYKKDIEKRNQNISTLYFDNTEYINAKGTLSLKDIFSEKSVFTNSYPKPVDFIKKLIQFSTYKNKNAIILDFFAGTGTTGHSVLDLNKEDEGKRQFILCTNNENNICEEVTYERINRLINGYTSSKNEQVVGLGSNLRYYQTNFISKNKSTDELKKEIAKKSCQLLCIKEGIFEEFDMTSKYNIYKENNDILAIYYSYDDSEIDKLKQKLNSIQGNKILYCFTFDSELNMDDFKDLINVNIKSIPQKMIEIFEEVNKS